MRYNYDFISSKFKLSLEPACRIQRLVDNNLSCRYEENAYILPFINWSDSVSCVLNSKKKVIREPNYNGWPENADLYDLSKVPYVESPVVYLGFLNTCFGHWFTDNLRKIWYLFSEEFKQMGANVGIKFAYTISSNRPLLNDQLFFFDAVGVNLRDAIVITSPTRFRELYIPDDSFCNFGMNGRQYTKEQVLIWNKIIKSIPTVDVISCEKLYLTRTSFNSSKEIGEQRVEKLFREAGYKIISPESLPLEEQLKVIHNAKVIATTEGSISHLALFCNHLSKLIILNKTNWVNTHQLCVNEYADLDITYIESHHTILSDKQQPWLGPFYLYVTPYLKRFFALRLLTLPYYLDKSYWKYSNCIVYRVYRLIKGHFVIKHR